MEYEFRQLMFDDGDKSLQQVVDLQNIVYEGTGHTFSVDGFRHWYVDNPMGKVISFNTFYGEELVGHYACIPIKMEIEGRVALGLLDMATVTHPNHRGKGLFKKLATITYEYAKKAGFEFVIGVANANSFHGYMKYFPFTFVGQLDVKMGFGDNILPDGEKVYKTHWDKESLIWRSTVVRNNYIRSGNSILGNKSFMKTYMGTFDSELLDGVMLDKRTSMKMRLYVGMGAKFKSPYMNVPKFIKHSPFNLIFMDLTDGKLPTMTKDNVFYQLIDFDVA